MDDYNESLGDAQVFTALDVLGGYWKVSLKDEDNDKTTFSSHRDTYRYTHMPFGFAKRTCHVPTYIEYFTIWSPTEDKSRSYTRH